MKIAVLPLSRNADLSPGRDLAVELRHNWNVEFDDSGAIGRRYRRQDNRRALLRHGGLRHELDDHAVTVERATR